VRQLFRKKQSNPTFVSYYCAVSEGREKAEVLSAFLKSVQEIIGDELMGARLRYQGGETSVGSVELIKGSLSYYGDGPKYAVCDGAVVGKLQTGFYKKPIELSVSVSDSVQEKLKEELPKMEAYLLSLAAILYADDVSIISGQYQEEEYQKFCRRVEQTTKGCILFFGFLDSVSLCDLSRERSVLYRGLTEIAKPNEIYYIDSGIYAVFHDGKVEDSMVSWKEFLYRLNHADEEQVRFSACVIPMGPISAIDKKKRVESLLQHAEVYLEQSDGVEVVTEKFETSEGSETHEENESFLDRWLFGDAPFGPTGSGE